MINKQEQPRYKHDCTSCTFLGRYSEYDLYFCKQGGNNPTVLARFSSQGPDYLSGMDSEMAPLAEARKRARTGA